MKLRKWWDIAISVYFIRAFKKKYGTTPNSYKKI